MHHHERRLPHWDVVDRPLFVTFRLHGSIPVSRDFPPPRITSGETFVAMDRLLDESTSGPLYLKQPELAQLVVNALRDGDARFHRYQLHSYVVMPNHVHLLATPRLPAGKWLGPLKGFTAHEANRILGRTGPFWQNESFDHLVRNDQGFRRIQRYIEHNPVKAGLAVSPEQYPWSSAFIQAAQEPSRSSAAG
jgi:REP element-mobilizing transposase RayT